MAKRRPRRPLLCNATTRTGAPCTHRRRNGASDCGRHRHPAYAPEFEPPPGTAQAGAEPFGAVHDLSDEARQARAEWKAARLEAFGKDAADRRTAARTERAARRDLGYDRDEFVGVRVRRTDYDGTVRNTVEIELDIDGDRVVANIHEGDRAVGEVATWAPDGSEHIWSFAGRDQFDQVIAEARGWHRHGGSTGVA